eukprot:4130628-Prymnesium_polylepis.1
MSPRVSPYSSRLVRRSSRFAVGAHGGNASRDAASKPPNIPTNRAATAQMDARGVRNFVVPQNP